MLRRDERTGIFRPIRAYTLEPVRAAGAWAWGHPAAERARSHAAKQARRAYYAYFGLGVGALLLAFVPPLFALGGGVSAYLARHHLTKALLLVPALLVAVGTQSWKVGLVALALLGISRWWIGKELSPDSIASELHQAAASYTKMPTTETYWRLERPLERYNRKTAGQYDRKRKVNMLLIPQERPIRPEKWTQVEYDPGVPAGQRSKDDITRIRHQYGPDFHDTDPNVRRALTRHMAGQVGRDLRATWQTDENWVVWVPLDALPKGLTYASIPKPEGRILIGQASANAPGVDLLDGSAVVAQDPDDDPHTLVAGKTRSGKTAYSRVRIAEWRRITPRGLTMLLWDGKRGGAFTYLEGQAGIEVTAALEAGLAMAHRTRVEMERRYEARMAAKRARTPVPVFPRWVLAIDEYMSVMDDLAGDDWKEAREELLTSLALISRKGGECRIHLELYTQRPDVQGVTGAGVVGQMRDQFFKVQIGQGTGALSKMLFEDSTLGLRVPALPKGRGGVLMTAENGEPELVVFQTPFAPDPLEAGTTFAEVVTNDTTDAGTETEDLGEALPSWLSEQVGQRRRRATP